MANTLQNNDMDKKKIMVVGHVDHGKTVLAEAIARVASESHSPKLVVADNDDLRKNNEDESGSEKIREAVSQMLKETREEALSLTSFDEDIFVENPRLKRRANNRKNNNGIKPKYMGKSNPFKKK